MKIPEKAPNWRDILESNSEKVFDLSRSDEMINLLQRANKEYLYWDRFKYLSMPEGVSSRNAWACLKWTRLTQVKKLPAIDIKDRQFGYWLPNSIPEELHYIDQHTSRHILVDNPSIHASERERYLVSSIMEEAIASSQLEGAATTRKKAKEMLRSGRKPQDRAEQMVYNNYLTIKKIKDLINEPLTPGLLKNLQASITENTLECSDDSGRFRDENDQYEIIDGEGHVLHIPPPANELSGRIQALCGYVNDDRDKEFIHPVIKAIILHFWLAYIHPFIDGNGRTSRALFYWYMLKNEYWMFEYLSISRAIIKAPAQYASAYLYSEMDDQDITYFISFHLRAIHSAIEELQLYLSKQQKETEEAQEFLRDYPGLNHRQYSLLYHAVSHSNAMYTINFYKNIHKVVHQTARMDLLALEKRGLLKKEKRGKTFYFIPVKNINKKLKGLEEKS